MKYFERFSGVNPLLSSVKIRLKVEKLRSTSQEVRGANFISAISLGFQGSDSCNFSPQRTLPIFFTFSKSGLRTKTASNFFFLFMDYPLDPGNTLLLTSSMICNASVIERDLSSNYFIALPMWEQFAFM